MLEIDKSILVGAVTDLLHNQSLPPVSGYGYAAEKQRHADAQAGLVRTSPERWTESPMSDGGSRMQVSRAYRRLEAAGLIVRHSLNGSSTSHLQPTAEGIELAATLMEGASDAT